MPKIGNLPIMPHVEFNGGVGTAENFGLSIANAYHAGAAYSVNMKGVNLTAYLAYKYNAFEKVSNDIQWTLIWSADIFDNKMTLPGFFDLWTENKNNKHESGKMGRT